MPNTNRLKNLETANQRMIQTLRAIAQAPCEDPKTVLMQVQAVAKAAADLAEKENGHAMS